MKPKLSGMRPARVALHLRARRRRAPPSRQEALGLEHGDRERQSAIPPRRCAAPIHTGRQRATTTAPAANSSGYTGAQVVHLGFLLDHQREQRQVGDAERAHGREARREEQRARARRARAARTAGAAAASWPARNWSGDTGKFLSSVAFFMNSSEGAPLRASHDEVRREQRAPPARRPPTGTASSKCLRARVAARPTTTPKPRNPTLYLFSSPSPASAPNQQPEPRLVAASGCARRARAGAPRTARRARSSSRSDSPRGRTARRTRRAPPAPAPRGRRPARARSSPVANTVAAPASAGTTRSATSESPNAARHSQSTRDRERRVIDVAPRRVVGAGQVVELVAEDPVAARGRERQREPQRGQRDQDRRGRGARGASLTSSWQARACGAACSGAGAGVARRGGSISSSSTSKVSAPRRA